MNITPILDHQWKDVKSIYLEAFPKSERKPFFTVRHSVKKGKLKKRITRNILNPKPLPATPTGTSNTGTVNLAINTFLIRI